MVFPGPLIPTLIHTTQILNFGSPPSPPPEHGAWCGGGGDDEGNVRDFLDVVVQSLWEVHYGKRKAMKDKAVSYNDSPPRYDIVVTLRARLPQRGNN